MNMKKAASLRSFRLPKRKKPARKPSAPDVKGPLHKPGSAGDMVPNQAPPATMLVLKKGRRGSGNTDTTASIRRDSAGSLVSFATDSSATSACPKTTRDRDYLNSVSSLNVSGLERRCAHARLRRRSSQLKDWSDFLEIKQAALEEMQRTEGNFDALQDDPNPPREWAGQHKGGRTPQYICPGGAEVATQKMSFWHRLAEQTSTKDTPPNELVRRSAFMLMSSLTCGAGLIWASLYKFVLDEPTAALFPAIYSGLMTLCFLLLTHEGRYHQIVFIQLLLILVLPICLQLCVGGIVKGGAVMIWSFLCPLGAALFSSPSMAKGWFVIYFVSMVATLLYELNLDADFDSADISKLSLTEVGLLVMNLGGAMTITFFGALIFSIRLDEEFTRAEELLHNILPKSITKRLKKGEIHIVENIDAVTILFADLVGFTKASSELHPNFLIGMVLRDVFSAWDELSQRRSIEKIKTIGDAYMCVGGLGDNEEGGKKGQKGRIWAYEMAILGLEMKRALDQVNAKYGTEFQVRIGLHSGPCIAGVIGVKRFAFDVWGDAVNTASRMESHGIPGEIHISADTYNNIKHLSYLKFECQGEINVKGKGLMTTYLVRQREGEMGRRGLHLQAEV